MARQLRTLFLLTLAMAALLPTLVSGEPPAKRVALVIGNASYSSRPLPNCKNDAQQMAAALRRVGFSDVRALIDADLEQMRTAVDQFRGKAGGALALFYFSGHGVQSDGKNYLIPVGVDIRTKPQLKSRALELQEVVGELEAAQVSVVIIDACRDDPLPAEAKSGRKGLIPLDAPKDSLIAFAASVGQTADANTEGRLSLYTEELLKNLEQPGLKLEEVFKRTRAGVLSRSANTQRPREDSALVEDIVLLPGDGAPPVVVVPLGTKAQPDKENVPAGPVPPDFSGETDPARVYTPEQRAAVVKLAQSMRTSGGGAYGTWAVRYEVAIDFAQRGRIGFHLTIEGTVGGQPVRLEDGDYELYPWLLDADASSVKPFKSVDGQSTSLYTAELNGTIPLVRRFPNMQVDRRGIGFICTSKRAADRVLEAAKDCARAFKSATAKPASGLGGKPEMGIPEGRFSAYLETVTRLINAEGPLWASEFGGITHTAEANPAQRTLVVKVSMWIGQGQQEFGAGMDTIPLSQIDPDTIKIETEGPRMLTTLVVFIRGGRDLVESKSLTTGAESRSSKALIGTFKQRATAESVTRFLREAIKAVPN